MELDANTLTHVAAILVGVIVTLIFVQGMSSSSSSKSSDRSLPAPTGTTAGSESASGASKKKKKSKSKKKATTSTTTDEAATKPTNGSSRDVAVLEEPMTEEQTVEKKELDVASDNAQTNGSGSKKKKKKKSGKGGASTTPAAPSQTTTTTNGGSTANAPKEAAFDALNFVDEAVENKPPPVVEEEWNTIGQSKKKKKTPASARPKPAAAAPAAAAAVTTTVTQSVKVDSKKIGIIIGPKGATMQAIQDATGCKLDVNAPPKDDTKQTTATVVITGDNKEAVAKAKKAVNELASKGYATLLQTDSTFGEHSITVHPRCLSEIVGPNGRNIQAIQNALNIKITIPKTDWKPNTPQIGRKAPTCKVGLAGSQESVKTAKETLQRLIDYHHTEITHPGMIHEEVYVPQEFFHCVIGPRGSEIKHIRGNYKVETYMPTEDSVTENVVVVGKPTQVEKAVKYIQLLMERDSQQRERKFDDEYY